MTNLFISYAKEDRGFVELLESALQTAGHRVWFDRYLNRGEFREQIEIELQRADVIIVVWSARSVRSHYVPDEAQQGVRRGVLLPVRIDDTPPPLGFRGHQTFDLSRWSGQADDPVFTVVLDEVARVRTDSTPTSERPPVRFLTHSLSAAIGLAVPCAVILALVNAAKLERPIGQAFAWPMLEAFVLSTLLIVPVMLWLGFELRRLGLSSAGLILRRASGAYALSAIFALIVTVLAVAGGVTAGLSRPAALAQVSFVAIVATLVFGTIIVGLRSIRFFVKTMRT